MWTARGSESPAARPHTGEIPDHAGLAYERWAPPLALGKTEAAANVRGAWLERLTQCREPARYEHAYLRWRDSVLRPGARCCIVRALGRVLIGHGNPVATGVGLTLHHTWGVPVLPGSALKGLTSSYVQTVYGPEPGPEQPDREPFRGVTWEDKRLVRGPGEAFRRLFGAPDVDGSEEKASAGEILFHDALWVPGKAKTLLARDVLTVHQRAYYESQGEQWPNDYDDPNPVSFLTVVPGGHFLIALELAPGAKGGRELLERAERYLLEALDQWGVGGKTAAGYGRFALVERLRPPESPVVAELKAWLEAREAEGVVQREQFKLLEQQGWERWLGLEPEDREGVARLLKHYLKIKKGEEMQKLEALLAKLRG
jgi:CRISPR-associated protein Cmr6